MSVSNANKLGYLAVASALLALVVAQGCSDSSDGQATPSGGSGSKAGSGGKSSGGGGGKAGAPVVEGGAAGELGQGGQGDTGNDGGMGGMGGEAGGGAECSDGQPDCFCGAPKTNAQFLNQCVEGGCPAHFDNSTLTKLNLVGTL